MHSIEKKTQSIVKYPPLKPFLGGTVLVALFYWEGSFRFLGLGIPVIQESFDQIMSFSDPAWKTLLTAITVGTGFKGGEFIPLVFIGSTLGSALSIFIPIGTSFLAALGFAAVFGGASNTPLACTVMAMEIFGYRIGPFALIACFASYYASGHRGIYRSQRIHSKKHIALMMKMKAVGKKIPFMSQVFP